MKIKIALIVAVIQSILFLGHYFVYKTFVRFFGLGNTTHLQLIRIVFFILSISFLLASLLAFRYFAPWLRVFYISASIWLGTFYWLFWASMAAWLFFGVSQLFGLGINFLLAKSLMALALLVSAYGVWNSNQTKIRHFTIKLNNLPFKWRGRRAVLVADTHFGSVRNIGFAKKISGIISSINPDIVFFAGDFFDGTPENLAALAQPLGQIKSRFGIFFAPGNHEEFGNENVFLGALRQAGIKVLENELVNIDGLQVAGVDYKSTDNAENERKILESLNINPNLASVLIKHAPSYIEAAASFNIGLQVSGHTHLGQVYPLGYLAKKLFGKFYYGLNRLNTTQVLTTSGVGTWGPPQRVGTNSEIIILTFT